MTAVAAMAAMTPKTMSSGFCSLAVAVWNGRSKDDLPSAGSAGVELSAASQALISASRNARKCSRSFNESGRWGRGVRTANLAPFRWVRTRRCGAGLFRVRVFVSEFIFSSSSPRGAGLRSGREAVKIELFLTAISFRLPCETKMLFSFIET